MHLDHIVFNAVDVEKMIEFYSEILGLPTERLDEYRSGKAPFPSLRINDATIIDLFPKQMWQGKSHSGPGHENLNHFCLALSQEQWQELLRRLEAGRVPVEEGPVTRWGARGDGTSIYFRDPENNLIEAKFYAAT
jgi:catechol 2,3-dioxygenase-like lactoylglutathione lyase family enzyme|uniref:VOC family protein n=1 Tax=Desulfomonile tiedjei TaxID=2358 RepID=A0A7C4AS14_9BACT